MRARKFSFVVPVVLALACTCSSLTPLAMVAPRSPAPSIPVSATLSAFARTTPLPSMFIPPGCENVLPATVSPSNAAVTPTSIYPTNTPLDLPKQIRVFEALVSKIESEYVYENYNGKDWAAIKAKYRAEVQKGLTTEQFYQNLKALIEDLGDEHSSFLTPQDVAEEDAQYYGKDTYVGVGVLIEPMEAKKKVTVLMTFPNSSAEQSGLRAHESLLAVDGKPIMEDGKAYTRPLRGPQCSAAVVTVQSPNGQTRNLTLIRHKQSSSTPILAQLLPTTDGSKIGYILIPTFLEEAIPDQIEKTLKAWGNLDGLILDDRLNTGGSEEVLERVLSYFTSGLLGQFKSRQDSRRLIITPQPINNSQAVPLVVLVGKDSVSFGEIFPGVLQDAGRAKLVGEKTAGNVETLYEYDFADGSRAWIAQEVFIPLHANKPWEGEGVKPDIEVLAEWDTFTFETDPVIAAGLKVLGRK